MLTPAFSANYKITLNCSDGYDNSVSIQKGKARSLDKLRIEALEKTLPQKVVISSIVSESITETESSASEEMSKNLLLLTQTNGFIIDEKLLSEKIIVSNDDNFIVRMQYAFEIESNDYNDSPIQIEATSNKQEYFEGENLVMTFKANTDGFLQIYLFDEQQQIIRVYPNIKIKSHKLKKNIRHEIPSKVQRKNGINFKTAISNESSYDTNFLYFFFSLEEITHCKNLDEIQSDITESTSDFCQFQRWLSKNSSENTSSKIINFSILKKN